MATDIYCTNCGKQMGRVPVCPKCLTRSEYWNLESPRVPRDGPSSSGPLASPPMEAATLDEAPDSLDSGSVHEVFTSWFEVLNETDDREGAEGVPTATAGQEQGNGNAAGGRRAEPVETLVDGGSWQTLDLDGAGPTRKRVAALEVVQGGEVRQSFYLYEGEEIRMGSAGEMEVVLSDQHVSRNHASIRVDRKAGKLVFTVKDLESRNGTFVNDSRISEMQVAPSDRLRIGKTELRLKVLDP